MLCCPQYTFTYFGQEQAYAFAEKTCSTCSSSGRTRVSMTHRHGIREHFCRILVLSIQLQTPKECKVYVVTFSKLVPPTFKSSQLQFPIGNHIAVTSQLLHTYDASGTERWRKYTSAHLGPLPGQLSGQGVSCWAGLVLRQNPIGSAICWKIFSSTSRGRPCRHCSVSRRAESMSAAG